MAGNINVHLPKLTADVKRFKDFRTDFGDILINDLNNLDLDKLWVVGYFEHSNPIDSEDTIDSEQRFSLRELLYSLCPTLTSVSYSYKISNVTDHTQLSGSWSNNYPTATEENPYVWVKTTYTFENGNEVYGYHITDKFIKGSSDVTPEPGDDTEKINITIHKVWNDGSGPETRHPSVYVNLKADGELIDIISISNDLTVVRKNKYQNNSLREIVYSVEELNLDGYTSSVATNYNPDSGDYTFTITNTPINADPTTYTVTVVADPSEGGAVSGGGVYQNGDTCTVFASPNTSNGYRFENWTNASNIPLSSSTRYQFTVTSDVTLTAHFSNIYYGYIDYNPNGGSGNQMHQSVASNQTTVTLFSNTTTNFFNNGYHLIGWDTNASATSPTYSLGQSGVQLATLFPNGINAEHSSVTLYAIWEANGGSDDDLIVSYTSNIDATGFSWDSATTASASMPTSGVWSTVNSNGLSNNESYRYIYMDTSRYPNKSYIRVPKNWVTGTQDLYKYDTGNTVWYQVGSEYTLEKDTERSLADNDYDYWTIYCAASTGTSYFALKINNN